MKKFMGRSFKGIVRSTFLIGPDGKIEEIWDPVRERPCRRSIRKG